MQDVMSPLTSAKAAPLPHPAWWRSAVVYEIHPRSFAGADSDGVGDLRNALRKRHRALTRGGYRPESVADGVFAYRRTDPDGDLLIALNLAAEEWRLTDAFRGVPLLSTDPQRTGDAASSNLRLAPHEGLVLAAP